MLFFVVDALIDASLNVRGGVGETRFAIGTDLAIPVISLNVTLLDPTPCQFFDATWGGKRLDIVFGGRRGAGVLVYALGQKTVRDEHDEHDNESDCNVLPNVVHGVYFEKIKYMRFLTIAITMNGQHLGPFTQSVVDTLDTIVEKVTQGTQMVVAGGGPSPAPSTTSSGESVYTPTPKKGWEEPLTPSYYQPSSPPWWSGSWWRDGTTEPTPPKKTKNEEELKPRRLFPKEPKVRFSPPPIEEKIERGFESPYFLDVLEATREATGKLSEEMASKARKTRPRIMKRRWPEVTELNIEGKTADELFGELKRLRETTYK